MAYGNKRKRVMDYLAGSSKRARRTRRATRRAGGNKAVARKQSQSYKPRTTRNYESINTLARQVKVLQKKEAGEFQKEFQHVTAGHGSDPFTNSTPVCLAMNDFTQLAATFIGKTVGGQNSFVTDTQWSDSITPGAGAGNEGQSYWQMFNKNHADKRGYRPISTTINVNFEAVNLPSYNDQWFRVDIIRPTKQLLYSTAHQLSLPHNIQGLSKLAERDMVHRNRINRTFFDIVETKWIHLKNDDPDNARTIEKWHKFTYRFSEGTKISKACENLNAMGSVDAHGGAATQTFITNVPQDSILWMVINTSNTGVGTKLQFTRYISYRDHHEA